MKKFQTKGDISILTENELLYLKTILKEQMEIWEDKHILEDLFRHSKYTIRFLTRQMANVDNASIFKKNRNINKNSTLNMIYRASILHAANTDVNKLFFHLSSFLFDQSRLDQLIINDINELTEDDCKFIKTLEK